MKEDTTLTEPTESWEDLPWDLFQSEVFHLQRRIYSASQNGKKRLWQKLQRLLLKSRAARFLAVQRVAEKNRGRNTAGIDGARKLTSPEKLELAYALNIQQMVSPVRRIQIPKPGKQEKRPLGIPTMADRALQALIALALEPEWEARFSPAMYGFRKGRGAHDAIASIRSSILRSPKWVLDADIEKFFDRVDHSALLKKLATFPMLESAIRRILRSGALEGSVYTTAEEGTPQGGPLSPLLANIALCGIDTALRDACKRWKLSDGRSIGRPPHMAIYADDFVVLHKERQVIDMCREHLSAWLAPMGLRLHPDKTRTVFTLGNKTENAGFDFLGHHIQQFRTGRYAVKPGLKQVSTSITPSEAARQRVYAKVAGLIDSELKALPKRKAIAAAERRLVLKLNPTIRGWANYFRHCKAKACFSRLDHQTWWKLWKALRRRYKKKGRKWTVQTFLKRPGGKWRVQIPGTLDSEDTVLKKFAETRILKHICVRKDQVYFNGDWAYWGKRLGRYPSIPESRARLLKQQNGKCGRCGNQFTQRDRVTIVAQPKPVGDRVQLIQVCAHQHCHASPRCSDNPPP
jgi:RNA-directed DNA polymerase